MVKTSLESYKKNKNKQISIGNKIALIYNKKDVKFYKDLKNKELILTQLSHFEIYDLYSMVVYLVLWQSFIIYK